MSRLIREYISEVITSDTYADTYRAGEEVHRDQRRRSGEPYYEHPKAVRNIMRRFYPSDKIGQLAALLHDALEDYEKGGVFKTEGEVLDRIGQSIENEQVKNEVIDYINSYNRNYEHLAKHCAAGIQCLFWNGGIVEGQITFGVYTSSIQISIQTLPLIWQI